MSESKGFVGRIRDGIMKTRIEPDQELTLRQSVPGSAYKAADEFTRVIKTEYQGRGFYYFFDPDQKVRFVLDQGNSADNRLYDKALNSINRDKIIIHTANSMSQAFGFKNNLDRLSKVFSFSERAQLKAYKKFDKDNVLMPSYTLKKYRSHAEYANMMFYDLVTADIWTMDKEETGLSKEDVDIEPQLVEAIYDFCKLDHIYRETSEWLEDNTMNKYLNREQEKKLRDIRDKNKEEAVYRIGYLKSLDLVFQEFNAFAKQFRTNKKVLNLESSLSSLSSLSVEMESDRENIVQKVLDLSVHGQALTAQTMALNSSLEEVLNSVNAIEAKGNGIIE